jgi:hypothetical protein
MKEAVSTSETSVYSNETRRRCILEDSYLRIRCHKNLKSHKHFRVSQTFEAKKEISCLSRKNCECACEKFGQEFNICSETNKPKFHVASKPYVDFGCVYFDV